MRPYPRDQLDPQKRIFNYRLSRARRIVEATFGVLARKWYVYRKDFECKVETVDKVVKASCVLHNYLIQTEIDYLSGSTTSDTSIFTNLSYNNDISNFGSYQVRDIYCSYFNNEGRVSWQDTRISSRLAQRN